VVRQSEAHSQSIHDIARSPDGSRLATAAADRKVRIFDLGTFAPLHDVTEGHYKGALAVAWSADGLSAPRSGGATPLRAPRARRRPRADPGGGRPRASATGGAPNLRSARDTRVAATVAEPARIAAATRAWAERG
jgi:hypothetical protein